jgi:gamma-glutamyltranspeptidase/glutathione hydrolase
MTFTTRPVLRGTFGMVAATHWLASASGMRMLELGGNAFDAAAAAGFVLQVVEPHQNGPGGDLPVVFWSAAVGEPQVLCAQGPAPAAARAEAFAGLDLVPGNGMLPAVVPGAFDGWMRLLRDHGTLSLRAVLEPAIGYAADGFPVVGELEEDVALWEPVFRTEWPTAAEVWLRGGGPRRGSLYRLPALAATYRRLVEEAEAAARDREGQIEAARDAFYRGWVADAIDRFVASNEVMDVSGERHRGLLRGDDLARWSATVEAPATVEFEGLTVCKPGPWSQGPVFLQQLALLDGFALDEMDTAEQVHTVVECAKLAFADREAWYGDPAFVDVPLDELLSAGYADERRRLVGDTASLELRPGSPGGRAPRLFAGGGGAAAVHGAPVGSDTCQVSASDRFGNVVSATPSGGWLKSSPTVPELGFCLGTRGQMFWLDEALPAGIAPGKRPRTTLSPTLVLRDGEPVLGFGTPGGDAQDQWSLQFFLSWVAGADLQAAIDAPKHTSAHFPSSFYPRAARPGALTVEGRVGEDAVAALRDRGHDVTVAPDWSLSRLVAAGREPSGELVAAADARGMMRYAAGR